MPVEGRISRGPSAVSAGLRLPRKGMLWAVYETGKDYEGLMLNSSNMESSELRYKAGGGAFLGPIL